MRRGYGFNFHKTFILHDPLWVYVTTALSVACVIAAGVLKLT
jgi:hypothetical protein